MPQELIITPVLNGFIVRAGCQTLVYDSADKIKMDFAEWVNDPQKIEQRYMDQMTKKGGMPPMCIQQPMAPRPPETCAAPVNAQCEDGARMLRR